MNEESIALRIKSNKRQLNTNNGNKSDIFGPNVGSNERKRRKINNKKDFDLNTYKSDLNINGLIDDALEEVFRHLSLVEKIRCQTVCKRWHQLMAYLLSKQTSIGMKNIAYNRSDCSLNSRHSVVNEDLIDKAVFEFNSEDLDVNGFDLRNAIQRNPNQCLVNLKSIFTKCPKVLSLDLRSIELNDSFVELIANYCPKLECLHLNSMVITDSVWHSITQTLSKRLIHLTIRNSIQSNQEMIVEELVRNCHRLKCLKVTEWNENLRFNWFHCICHSVDEITLSCTSAKTIFKSIDNKKTLNIKRFKLSTFEALTQSVIDTIGSHFLNLTQISLRNCEGFSKRSFRPIAQLVGLKHLTMDLPFANCDEDFAYLATSCPQMRSIEMSFGLLTLNSLQIFSKHWPQLESISFRFVTIEKLNSEALDVFMDWKHLRRLTLKGTNICDDICRLIESSDSLRYLNLDLCNIISETVFQSFFSSAKLRPKELFELSVKETKINRFKNTKHLNNIAKGVVRLNNVYVYYTNE